MIFATHGASARHEHRILDALAASCSLLGHREGDESEADFLLCWNGRSAPIRNRPALYVECGWLPRWSYQVSHRGINARHHLAGSKPRRATPQEAFAARMLPEQLRRIGPRAPFRYADATLPALDGLPGHFCFVPLQVATDTNMAAVPEAIRTPEQMIRYLDLHCATGLPVVYKTHPASDAHHEDLAVDPPHLIVRHGTVHQILRHPGCRLLVTANSNTAHDALIWNVPAVVLGRGIWPETGPPFFHRLTGSRDEAEYLAAKIRTREWRRRTIDYIAHLQRAQWTVADAADPERVRDALREGGIS